LNHARRTTDDAELVGRSRPSDERSFEELVRRYRERVYWVVYCYLRDREDACKLAQDVFVRAFRALPKSRGDCSFYTWVD
jgi:RNA polymerase sigma-70 factor (ECF subfamily)